jgi:glycosyltransferase involved in cell wall biosynthesis
MSKQDLEFRLRTTASNGKNRRGLTVTEGGANVISEAGVAGLPAIASDIEGSLGLLGADYPGYYPVGGTDSLRERLLRAESDCGYSAELVAACAARRHPFTPQQELAGWELLLEDIQASGAG